MRTLKLIVALFLFTAGFYSCQKEYFSTPALDPNTPISFSKDLMPIMNASCSVSGCHDKSISPNLLPASAFTALTEGGFVDTTNAESSILMIKLNTNMPPSKLPKAEINKFLLWMKQGAQDN